MRLLVGATLLALVPASPALAANVDVNAVDNSDGINHTWSTASVAIQTGDTVTWRFDGTTVSHNVRVDGTPVDTPFLVAGPPAQYQFTAVGTYAYVCELHPATMSGTVTVGNPPPPPPPPLSAQPFENDQAAPVVDTTRPSLTGVQANGRRLRFALSERANVVVKVKRGKRTVARRSVSRGKGSHSLTFAGLRAGTYRFEVRATDLGGNRSRPRTARTVLR